MVPRLVMRSPVMLRQTAPQRSPASCRSRWSDACSPRSPPQCGRVAATAPSSCRRGAALPPAGSPGWAVLPPPGWAALWPWVSVGSVGTTVGRPLEDAGAAVDDGSATAQAANTTANSRSCPTESWQSPQLHLRNHLQTEALAEHHSTRGLRSRATRRAPGTEFDHAVQ